MLLYETSSIAQIYEFLIESCEFFAESYYFFLNIDFNSY